MQRRRRWPLVLLLAVALAGRAAAREPAEPVLHVQGGHSEDITSVDLSSTGTHVLTASMDRTLRLWESETGREVRVMRIEPRRGGVLAARFLPGDTHVLAACLDGAVRVFETATGREDRARRLDAHKLPVSALALTADGRRVATASYDGTARLFDVTGGAAVGAFRPPGTTKLFGVDVRADGAVLATAGEDGAVTLFNVATGQLVHALQRTDAKAAATCVVYERDQRHVLVGYNDGAILRWDAQARQVVKRYAGHTGNVHGLSVRIDGRYVLTASADGTSRLFEIESGQAIGAPRAHAAAVKGAVFARSGVAAVTISGRRARLWDIQRAAEVGRFEGSVERVLEIALTRDGQHLAVATTGGVVHLWGLATGRVVRRFVGHTDAVGAIAFSADGTRLLTGAEDTTVRLWDTARGTAIRQLTRHTQGTHSVGVSGDGRRFVTGGCDDQVRVWASEEGGALLQTLRGHAGNVESVALSDDGAYVLTGSIDTTVRLWSVADGKELWRYEAFTGPVTQVAFSPTDPSRVAAASHDGHARILDRATGRVVQSLEGRTVEIDALAFSPDGTKLATGTADGQVRVWTVGGTGQDPRLVLTGHAKEVKALAFSPDGRFLFTGSYDQTVRVHDSGTGTLLATLVSFEAGGFAVLDAEGRFDASDAGSGAGLHWLLPTDGIAGRESVSLDQLKARYFEPGLLAKALGFNPEPPRPAAPLAATELAPRVEVADQGGVVEVRVANRGAGIGKVVVQVNGKEVRADARPRGADPNAAELTIPVDLSADPRFIPGADNEIRVFAYDKTNGIRSRGGRARRRAAGTRSDASLWAVIGGVSDYAGEGADLLYATKDARDFHQALELAAGALFEDRVHITLVADARRAALLEALEAARQAKPEDVFVLYLAGHGATYKDDFHFLTAEAGTANVTDDAMREAATVSSSELTDAINRIPAQKVVVILDTCASGRFIEDLTGQRGVPASQRRALDRLKDRTGTHIIAGCAADRLSFENPRYGQGLLTYSLLLGMKGKPLREGGFVDVAALFGFAEDQVPALAQEIGREQNPVVARPTGGSTFDLGRLTGDARLKLPVRTPKPYVTRSLFIDPEQSGDVQGLVAKLDAALREASAPGTNAPFVFWNTDPVEDAYRIAGTYRLVDGGIEATFKLWQGTRKPVSEKLVVTASLERLPAEILERALEHLPPAGR